MTQTYAKVVRSPAYQNRPVNASKQSSWLPALFLLWVYTSCLPAQIPPARPPAAVSPPDPIFAELNRSMARLPANQAPLGSFGGHPEIPAFSQTGKAWTWFQSRYQNPSLTSLDCGALIQAQWKLASALLESSQATVEEKASAVVHISLAARAAGNTMHDFKLGVEILDTGVMPHLSLLTAPSTSALSREATLVRAASIYSSAGRQDRLAETYAQLAACADNPNSRDAALLKQAQALFALGQEREAKRCLKQIGKNGGMDVPAAKLLDHWEELAKQDRKNKRKKNS